MSRGDTFLSLLLTQTFLAKKSALVQSLWPKAFYIYGWAWWGTYNGRNGLSFLFISHNIAMGLQPASLWVYERMKRFLGIE